MHISLFRHRFVCLMLTAAFLFGSLAPARGQDDPPAGTDPKLAVAIDAIIAQMQVSDLDGLWPIVNQFRRLPEESGPVLIQRAGGASQLVRLGLARAACWMGQHKKAAPILLDLARRGKSFRLRRQALSVLGLVPKLFPHKPTRDALRKALEEARDPKMKILLAKALWRISQDKSAIKQLKKLVSSDDPDVSGDAALVLGENGQVDERVSARLLRLFGEPTERGERALTILFFEKLRDEAAEKRPEPDPTAKSKGMRVLREILSKIRDGYVDPEKPDVETLLAGAVRGMVGELDDFSGYLDEEASRAMQEQIAEIYGGIGAYVGMRNDRFTIISPIYGGPAYKIGLKSLDQVWEVDGKRTDKIPFEKVISHLKGTPGTPVLVKIYRRGWTKPQEFTIIRERIKVPNVHSRMLPGGLGYLRLVRFGSRTTGDMSGAMKALQRKGMRALVLDLRDNPGGLLQTSVDVASMFVGERKIIVYSEGRLRRRNHYARDAALYPDLPVVVLINSGSASASEIVSGTLQGHGRAKLIGVKTYGKGSVQSIIPLHSTLGATHLKLTIAKYFLPDPKNKEKYRSIHQQGVDPDIVQVNPEIPGWHVDYLLQYRKAGRFQAYVDGLWKGALREILDTLDGGDEALRKDLVELNGFNLKRYARKPAGEMSASARARHDRLHGLVRRLRANDAFAQKIIASARAAGAKDVDEDDDILAALPKIRRHHLRRFYEVSESDYAETSVYPGFDAFYRGLNADVPDSLRDSVRHEIRRRIRQRVADERGAPFAVDIEEDVQLQRAIVELMDTLGTRVAEHKLYRPFADKFAKKTEPANAAAAEMKAQVQVK